jgi:hypothetical protein
MDTYGLNVHPGETMTHVKFKTVDETGEKLRAEKAESERDAALHEVKVLDWVVRRLWDSGTLIDLRQRAEAELAKEE